jgi:hypothetical protein
MLGVAGLPDVLTPHPGGQLPDVKRRHHQADGGATSLQRQGDGDLPGRGHAEHPATCHGSTTRVRLTSAPPRPDGEDARAGAQPAGGKRWIAGEQSVKGRSVGRAGDHQPGSSAPG